MTRVKLCGLMSEEDIRMAEAAGFRVLRNPVPAGPAGARGDVYIPSGEASVATLAALATELHLPLEPATDPPEGV